jgi:hypothetical protein
MSVMRVVCTCEEVRICSKAVYIKEERKQKRRKPTSMYGNMNGRMERIERQAGWGSGYYVGVGRGHKAS